jgi:phage FluMu gp28-like protein
MIAANPREILLRYQRDWVQDDSRFKVGCWARQTGKSFATAQETVEDCLARKTTWVTVSAGERQAIEWLAKANEWTEAYQVAIEDQQEVRDGAEALLKQSSLTFANGSRIIALPANPATVRGYSANLTLDEFAFHEDPAAIWRAVYPSISNPLRGEYKIRIVSTPNGKGNKFHDLFSKGIDWSPERGPAPGGKWSRHLIDIHSAVARGLPLDIEQLKEGLDDPDGWAQEYECQFLDASMVLLPYEVIAAIENLNATAAVGADYWTTRGAPVDLGIDIGRKKNLTVCWALEDVAGAYGLTREVLELANMPTDQQVEVLSVRVARARRVSLDATGYGMAMGDYLVKRFGEWAPEKHKFGKIELCTFSAGLKQEIFSRLRMAADKRSIGIPISRVIREDLHSVHRITTASGNITYAAPLVDGSHADRCTALALAVRARSAPASAFAYSPVDRGPRGRRRIRR